MSLASHNIGSVPFEDFDPNTFEDDSPMWAVYKDGRFKAYATRGPALNAFLNGARCKLYERRDGRWFEWAVKDNYNRPDKCVVCTEDVSNVVYGGSFVFDRRGGKLLEPLVLLYCCSKCKSGVLHS